MTSEIEKLTARRDAILARRKRRAENDNKDRNELYRLEQQMERETAKSLVGQTVVLNPLRSIQTDALRKLRGMTGKVESIGRKYLAVRFENGECWRVCFGLVVLATPENAADDKSGQLADSLTDGLNSALWHK